MIDSVNKKRNKNIKYDEVKLSYSNFCNDYMITYNKKEYIINGMSEITAEEWLDKIVQ